MARKTYFKGRNIRFMQGGGHPLVVDYGKSYQKYASENPKAKKFQNMYDLTDEDIDWMTEDDLKNGAKGVKTRQIGSWYTIPNLEKRSLRKLLTNRKEGETMGQYIRRFLEEFHGNNEKWAEWLYDIIERAGSTKYNKNITPQRFYEDYVE